MGVTMVKEFVLEKVRKRDGRLVQYNRAKVESVILKAGTATETELPAAKLAEQVEKKLTRAYAAESGSHLPDVEDIQDLVEEILMEAGLHQVARHFILYREQRAAERSAKSALLGKIVRTDLSLNALKLLKERYLLRDDERGWYESPAELFERVATAVAKAEKKNGADEATQRKWKNKFKRIMKNLDFMPNSPTLMNAGTAYQQLASSIAIPVGDDLDAIYRGLHDAAKMQQVGCGTGFNFSKLRRAGSRVKGIEGVASGPLTFLQLYSESVKTVKQGGRRQGGNMAILEVTHPDILDFITAKAKQGLENFNLSVLMGDDFIHGVIADREYSLRDPGRNESAGRINAKQVFDLVVASAWNNADPGVLFKDAIRKSNPIPSHTFCATSACAEFLLSPYEQGFLGSINLANFVTDEKQVDWKRLKEVVAIAVRFLDDMIDASKYPIKRAATLVFRHRKIGLGVMGLAHLLVQLGIPFNSDEGVKTAGKVMKFLRESADEASLELGKERSPFPDWNKSIYCKKSKHFAGTEAKFRNATRLAVSPTGSTSMIAETSSGIEPLFSVSYVKKVLGGEEFYYVDPFMKARLEELGLYSEELVERIANFGLQATKEVPEELKRLFVTTHDIAPEWHVKIQAEVQKHVDNAVSKTVNLPANATLLDVENVFLLAWKLGCKGCTIYRDGSKGEQVLTATALLGKVHERQQGRSVREELKVLASNKSLNEFSK
ncbi:adenosylcobalamin-dependent ribonucleoside-diphosphate reductase [Candidatus Woesearchaeota archaeon]|nr:adenosylcobalamin-dependent ribonucleoside-diphosphate reductase [Candidatus Woesearchaeota archaeon]